MMRVKNRSAIAMIILSAAIFPKTSLAAMDGLTEATAFTALGMLQDYHAQAGGTFVKGLYHFNIEGVKFQAYALSHEFSIRIPEPGIAIRVLLDLHTDPARTGTDIPIPVHDNGGYEGASTVDFSRFILSPQVLAKLTDINKIRYQLHNGIAVTTTDTDYITRLTQNKPIMGGLNDYKAGVWSGFNIDSINLLPTCHNTTSTDTLAHVVIWVCDEGTSDPFLPAATQFVPRLNAYRVQADLGNRPQRMRIDAYAASVDIPVATGEGLNYDKLIVTKTASDDTDVTVGQVITYTYVITNYTADMITNISMAELLLGIDSHNGSGTITQPDIEAAVITEGAGSVIGDSYDLVTSDDKWDALAPGDSLTVTASYTVTQADIDQLQ